MVTEYEQGGLNLACDDAMPDCSRPTDAPNRTVTDSPNGPRLYLMEIEESASPARESRVSDDLGILDTNNGWPCGGCCSLIQEGEKGPRKSPATRLARSVRTLCHDNRRVIVVGVVAVVVVMVIVAVTIYCSRGRTESKIPVTGLNVTVLGRGRVVQDVLPSHNQTTKEYDQQTIRTFLVRSLEYELRRLVDKTRFRHQCTGLQAVKIDLEDGIFEYELACYNIKDDHFTHDLRADMVDFLGAKQAADLGIFVLDLASLQPHTPAVDEPSSSEPPYTPVLIPECFSVLYNRTCYPNVLHHQSQFQAVKAGLASIFLLENRCSSHMYRFWCSIFVPDCTNEVPLPPCRSLCQAVLTDCPHLRPDIEQLLDGGCWRLPDADGTPCTGVHEEAGSSQECHEVPVEECRNLGFTLTPGSGNLLGQTSTASLHWWHELENISRTTQCSPHLMTFGCSVFYPQCTEAEVASDRPEFVGPCESLCLAVKRDCGFFFSLVGMQFLADYNCSNHLLPGNQHTCAGTTVDVNSTDVECREDQFQCDPRQCVSSKWICDGRKDCVNGNDEKDCAECPAKDESFRCKNGHCLPLATRCDGHVDCLQAEDEVDCLRVSTEDAVEGLIEVYNPFMKHWEPVCLPGSLDDTVAETLCGVSRLTVLTDDGSTLLGFLITRTNCSQHQQSFVHCNYTECSHGPLQGQASRLFGLPRFGQTLADGDWPWVVSLHGGRRRSFYCSGFLVTDQWVVTAAHCIGSRSQLDDWTVIAGHSRRTALDTMRQVRSVLRLAVHPSFSAAHMDEDIALVLVDRPFRLGPSVRSLCLPDDSYQPMDGQTCYVGGWGKTSDTDRDYSEQLRLRQLTVQPLTWCHKVWPALPSFYDGKTLCTTGRHGSDVCKGDSGSAVLCESIPSDGQRGHRRLVLAGVVSRGFECGHPLIPSVQTAIAPYADWIRREMSTSL